MKVLVDTNVLLDVALGRMPFLASSDAVVRWCQAYPGHGFIAWHSISNIHYILKKPLGDPSARRFLATLLDIFEVAETGTAVLTQAKMTPGRKKMGDTLPHNG